MTRKSLKSGKSSRQKQSSEDIGNSEAGLVEQQAAQAQAEELAAPDAGQEAELESDAEPEPEAPTLTELIISKFAGDKVNGQFEGFGFMEFANGNLYEGEFYHGTMHGKGKYTWTATGMVYEGDFYCNQITGVGKYTWDDGSSYDGQVVQGVRHGVGVYTHPSGLSYDGQWHMGMKQGQGKLSYSADGSSYYEGQWLADRPHGEGVRRYPSGNVYQGMWYAGLRHGQGTMRWADKDETYTGQWEDGVQHGVGQHTWYLKRAPNSQYMLRNIYEGDFFKGRRHGYGVFYYPSGSRYEGQWANDMKCGHGKFIFKNGRVFEGQFKDDRMVEFPSFTHDGRTTPDHVSIRTRSPLPGEVHSVHSNASVNTLSPGFQLGLDHIFLAGELFDCDLEEETGQASFVAIHYLDKLRRIYNYYATLGTGELEDNANVLTMLQFWRLMKDCRFINDDWTLAKFNRLLVSNYDPLTPETAHNPYKKVVFLDFLNHLVTIAYHLYGTSMNCEKGLLASCFSKLIKERLLPNACSVRGRLFQDSRRGQHAAAAYAKPLWPVFQQQCQCERGLPTRSRLGLRGASASGGRSQSTGRGAGQGQQGCYPPREWVLSVRQFLRMLHQFNLIDEQRLTPSKVVEILSADDEFISDGQFLLLDREMTFLEFFEGLIGFAAVAIEVSSPAEAAAAAAAAATEGAGAAVESVPASTTSVAASASVDAAATTAPAPTATVAAAEEKAASLQATAAPGRAPNEPPPLPDETYLLAPPEPPTEATSEAGDAPVGDETPKSPIDPQHQKSKASDGGRTERGGAGASSGAGQGAAAGGGAGGRGGAGSLRAPQQQDSKHSARDRQQPSRGSRDQDKRSIDGGPVAAAGRKSQKSVALGGSSGAAAAAAAAAAATAAAASEADDDLREASRDGGSRDALRVASEVEAGAGTQSELEFLTEDEAASLSDEEKKALIEDRKFERWQRQLQSFIAEKLVPAAELQAVIWQRMEARQREELLKQLQEQQQPPQPQSDQQSEQQQNGTERDQTEDNQSVATDAEATTSRDEEEEEE